MKKLVLLLSAGSLLFFAACNSKKAGGLSDAAKKNLDAAHGITKCMDTKDFSKLGDFIATDCIDHAGEQGDIKGLDNLKKEMEKMTAGYENSKTEVIKELADDEYVMSWQRYTGTMKVEQMGLKAGDKYDMAAIELSKFKDGKAVEHWSFMQPADMMKMMGGAAPPVMDNKMNETTEPVKDTASK